MIIHYMCSLLSIGQLLQCIVRMQNTGLCEIFSTQNSVCTFKHWIHMLHTCAMSVVVVSTPMLPRLSMNDINPPTYLDVGLQQDVQLVSSISVQLIVAWGHVNTELLSIFWYSNR